MSPPIQEDYNDEDDTGDYSSYWQSIPDPPMLDSASASSSSSSMKPFEICQDDNVLQQSLLSSTRSASTAVDLSVGQSSGSTITVKKRLRDVTNQHQLQQQQQLANATRTTKKQRRSLLLPCDDNEQSVTDNEAYELKLSSCSSISNQHGAVSTREATAAVEDTKPSASLTAGHNNNKNNDQHTQQRLIQLVREYCALPNNNTHQRIHSQQAQEIELLSSYPMPGKKFQLPTADLSSNSSNNNSDEDGPTNDDKRKQKSNTTTTTTTTNSKEVTFQQEFILHLKPIVHEMEHQKQTDMMEARTATQCEMYKSRGRCYYVDVGTGDEVDPREYERRYLSWIGRRRLERLDCDSRRRRSDIGNEVAAEAAAAAGGGEEVSSDCESSFDMDQSVNMDDSMMSSAASSSVDDSMSEVDTTNTAAAATAISSETSSRNSGNTHPSAASDIKGNTSDGNSGTSIRGLGLPSLPPSNDARVLAARTKLWQAIDAALENYSKEILAIQQGR